MNNKHKVMSLCLNVNPSGHVDFEQYRIFLNLATKINYCFMGKGDKKTKRGKIIKGTFGNSRPRKVKKRVVAETKSKAKAQKKAPSRKTRPEASKAESVEA